MSADRYGGAAREGHRLSRRDLLRRSAGTVGALALAGGAAGLLAACTSAAPSSSAVPASGTGGAVAAESPRPGGTLVFPSTLGDPDTLFAGLEQSTVAKRYFLFMANGLAKVRYPDWEIVPDIASTWEMSSDATTYTFKLRPGVTWHDGEPFTAEDVKFTFEFLTDKRMPGPLLPKFSLIQGAPDWKAGRAQGISGIQVVAPDQVKFTLSSRNALFLSNTATTIILPKHVLKDVDPATAAKHPFSRQPVYTGPFKLEEWKSLERITWKANVQFFGGRPLLDGIVVRNVPDQTVGVQMVKTGEATCIVELPADQFAAFQNDPKYTTAQYRRAYPWFIEPVITNPKNAFFADVNVRRAMSHAIDRDTVVKNYFKGLAEPAYNWVSSDYWMYDPKVATYPYDPAKAKALLDAAGWLPGPDGIRQKDGKRIEFTLNVHPATVEWAQLVLPMFQALGMTFKINNMEFTAWIAQLKVDGHEASINASTGPTNDPRVVLGSFETPRSIGLDRTGYNDPEVTDLFKRARNAASRDDEKRLYDQILEKVAQNGPYIYLWAPKTLYAGSAKLAIPKMSNGDAEFYQKIPTFWFRP